jgi:hypothetical protein
MPIPPGSPTPRGTPAGPALLAFFSPSSPACAVAVPVYAELGHRYGDVLPVVAVAARGNGGGGGGEGDGGGGGGGSSAEWLDGTGFAGPLVDEDKARRLVDGFEIDSVPTLVLVEAGRVLDVSVGWDRDGVNRWDELLSRYTGRRSPGLASADDDGRPASQPGDPIAT